MKMMMDHKRIVALAVVTALAACGPKGEELYARAEKSLAGDVPRAAVIDLKNLVSDEPENGKARALLASALVAAGDVAAAAIELQKARDLKTPAELLVVPDCQVTVAQGDYNGALAKCDPAKGTGDSHARLQVGSGQALLGLERPAEAKAMFDAAHKTHPVSLPALIGLANATFATSGPAAGQAVMKGAAPEAQEKPGFWLALGGLHSQAGELDQAEAAYQKALDLAVKGGGPGTERLVALGALGETQMRLGKIDEATRTTDQLLKAAPDNPLVKQLRGQVAAAGGKLGEARTLLEQAVAEMPDNQVARTVLGIVNLQQGNVGQAEMHFQTVLAAQPNNVRVQRLLAEARAKTQTPEQTLASLQPALTSGAADPSLLAMAGRMSLASGNREQALAYLSEASAKPADALSPDVQIELANSYIMAGDMDRAVEVLEKMPPGGAGGFQRDYLLMAALLRKGDSEKAAAEASRIAAKNPDNVGLLNLAGGVLAAAGKPADARKQFNAALKVKPADAATLINIARLDLAEGKRADARKNFAKVLEADEKNMVATIGMAAAAGEDIAEAEKWLRKASDDHPNSVEARVSLVQFYITTREFQKARQFLDASMAKDPDNAALLNASGLVSMGLGDLPAAVISFKKAATLAPRSFGYAMNLARAHVANRDPNSALSTLNDILKLEPTYVPALALGAAMALQSGKVENAAGFVERLNAAAPDSQMALALEGDLAVAQKRYKDALLSYRKASAKTPTTALVLSEFRAAQLAGEPQPEKILEGWVAKYPSELAAVNMLAEQKRATGDVKGAAQVYEASLKAAPDNAMLLNNLATVYDELGDARAVQYAEGAYKAAPKSAAIQDTYGWILFKKGQLDRSIDLLRAANAGLPDNAEVQYHLGAALAKKGDKSEAASWLNKALKGRLPPKAKADAQALLGRLK